MRHRITADQALAAVFTSLAFLVAVFLLAAYCPKNSTRVYAPTRTAPAAFDASALFPDGSIDPNTAQKEAFMVIPGIGEKTAEAIIAEREANGPFYFPEDLLAVKGIGEKKLAVMRPFLCFPAVDEE